MSSFNFDFDVRVSDVPETSPADLLPPGDYLVTITAAAMRPTKKNDGAYLHVECSFEETAHPELRGRKVWDVINIVNPNPKAVELARQSLAKICRAVGVEGLNTDTIGDILYKPLVVRLGIEPAKDGYDAKNKIKNYKTASPATAPTTSETKGKMPWEK